MRALLLAAALCCFVGSTMAAQESLVRTFESDRPGVAPEGFTFAAARQARPGAWVVRADAAGQALVHEADVPSEQGFGLAIATRVTYDVVAATIKMKMVGGERTGGLVWRYEDPLNYYAASLDLTRQELAIYRVVRGNRIRLEREDDLDLDPAAWHTLRIVHDSETARLYLGGIRVFSMRDRTAGGGHVGVWATSGSTIVFDDLRVQRAESRRR